MGSISIQETNIGLHVQFPQSYSEQELAAALTTIRGLFQEWGVRPFSVITDSSKVQGTKASRRRMLAEFLHEHDDYLRSNCFAWAFVVSNTVVRGALTAIFWIKKPGCPTKVFTDVVTAKAWLLENRPGGSIQP